MGGKNHGLKAQSLDAPDGLSLYLYGLESLRNGDLSLLEWSNIEDLFRQVHAISLRLFPSDTPLVVELRAFLGLQAQDEANIDPDDRFKLLGDSIYPINDVIESDGDDEAKNAANHTVCQSVEHHYGENEILWPFMHARAKMKICSGMPLTELYFCQVFLRNIYNCLYHNKTADRFKCFPPSLEGYLSWAD